MRGLSTEESVEGQKPVGEGAEQTGTVQQEDRASQTTPLPPQ